MIDLEKLEKRIDESLKNLTKEDCQIWFDQAIIKIYGSKENYLQFLKEEEFERIDKCISILRNSQYKLKNDIKISYYYSMVDRYFYFVVYILNDNIKNSTFFNLQIEMEEILYHDKYDVSLSVVKPDSNFKLVENMKLIDIII